MKRARLLLGTLVIAAGLSGCWDSPDAETPLIRMEVTITHRFEDPIPTAIPTPCILPDGTPCVDTPNP